MKKELKERILKGEIVDTRKYRYTTRICQNSEKQWEEIIRLPLEYLDTAAAIDGWETVEIIKE